VIFVIDHCHSSTLPLANLYHRIQLDIQVVIPTVRDVAETSGATDLDGTGLKCTDDFGSFRGNAEWSSSFASVFVDWYVPLCIPESWMDHHPPRFNGP
jgi:hypothetical protein